MRRTNIIATAAVVAGLAAVAAPLASVSAGAVTGYPPSTTTLPNGPGPFTLNDQGPTVQVYFGTSGSYCVQGFKPNATVNVSVNHVQTSTVTADSNGSVCLTIDWVDTNGPHVIINGGTPVAINLGVDDIALDGPGPNGPVDQSAFFDPISAHTTAATSSLAFTGADIAAMTIGGLVLIGGGTALVLASRRRSSRRAQ